MAPKQPSPTGVAQLHHLVNFRRRSFPFCRRDSRIHPPLLDRHAQLTDRRLPREWRRRRLGT
ncbi:hypothetical protein QRX50_18200 [Amycolatopsis carbonis]|uniref:Uncharacterized protein n=1 Tax=Amycolatopsis carbonis TaxID=715471 RepID=A0A9Y2IMC8_9PSEU|nr:hypothetical protein [Amycolatopsis sp. 2-15]WIX82559.1 hypothetical protein QRX50_18200 [Amycolatopsis sp. 2-15]